jgi:hypothetical protein
LKGGETSGEFIDRYRRSQASIAAVPINEIAGVRIAPRTHDDYPAARGFAPHLIEFIEADASAGNHNQRSESDIPDGRLRSGGTVRDAGGKTFHFQARGKFSCTGRIGVEQQNWHVLRCSATDLHITPPQRLDAGLAAPRWSKALEAMTNDAAAWI